MLDFYDSSMRYIVDNKLVWLRVYPIGDSTGMGGGWGAQAPLLKNKYLQILGKVIV